MPLAAIVTEPFTGVVTGVVFTNIPSPSISKSLAMIEILEMALFAVVIIASLLAVGGLFAVVLPPSITVMATIAVSHKIGEPLSQMT